MHGHIAQKPLRSQEKNNDVTKRRPEIVFVFCLLVMACVVFYSKAELHLNVREVKLEISTTEPSTCMETNKTPKVALMFLSVDKLHNEPTWRAFFEAAGRLCLRQEPSTRFPQSAQLPRTWQESRNQHPGEFSNQSHAKINQSHQHLKCTDEKLMIEAEADRFMSRDWNATDLIDRQTLFSVYVNSVAYATSEEPSIFTTRVVDDPIDTHDSYANFLPVLATLKLMKEALKDPRNQKFVLLSESCIPIQPPELIHAQLISETLSRARACAEGEHNLGRWNWEIVDYDKWRKGSQFFSLKRSHAQLAVDDIEMQWKFSQHCFTSEWSVCIPDEHFIPTLLANHDLENETDCTGYVTSSEWWPGYWHPITYNADTIDSSLLKRLAEKGVDYSHCDCDVEQARATTAAIYSGFSSISCVRRYSPSNKTPNKSHWILQQGYRALQNPCPMFARKFSDSVVRETLESALSCEATGLGYWCY